MKKAFTLIELLVVVAIIGLLIGSLIYIFGNTDSAKNAKCKANLKILAGAVTAAMGEIDSNDDRHYPLAGSHEWYTTDMHAGGNSSSTYGEWSGWISWNSKGSYPSTSSIANEGWLTSAYCTDNDARLHCITNGSIYKFMSGNIETYVCPAHAKKHNPAWSYVMNSRFGYCVSRGEICAEFGKGRRGVRYGSLDAADKTLLFAEMQWADGVPGITPDVSAAPGFKNDCTLQYGTDEGGEIIGFNHKQGDDWIAHVAYADGHVTEIKMPKGGLGRNELQRLTEFLCEGKQWSFENGKAVEIK